MRYREVVIVSYDFNFIFIKTRKTAGTSTEIALSKYLGSRDIITPCMPIEEEEIRKELGFRGAQNFGLPILRWKPLDYADFARGHRPKRFNSHSSAEKVAQELGDKDFERFVKVITVRNPFTYVVSLYNWHARSIGSTPEGFRSWLVAGQGDLRHSNYSMGKVNGRFEMDMVLHFETLEEGFRKLIRELDMPKDAIEVFKTLQLKTLDPRRSISVRQAYEFFPDARDLVESRFEEEIVTFDYKFPF